MSLLTKMEVAVIDQWKVQLEKGGQSKVWYVDGF